MENITLIYNIFFNIHRTNGETNGIALAAITLMLMFVAVAIIEYIQRIE